MLYHLQKDFLIMTFIGAVFMGGVVLEYVRSYDIRKSDRLTIEKHEAQNREIKEIEGLLHLIPVKAMKGI